jgi:hypothetical protein
MTAAGAPYHHHHERKDHRMTTALPQTQASRQADLLLQLRDVLASHPDGAAVRLVYVPDGLPLADDEVLVQTVYPERRTIELLPWKISDIRDGDVLHDTQVIDPADTDLIRYAADPRADECHIIRGFHYYST